jgi:transcription antitermination protein NusB
MDFSQQKFREIIFQLLFSQDFTEMEEEVLDFMMEQLSVTKKTMYKAQDKWRLIVAKLPEVDEKIKILSSSYDFDRISKVEKNILRLGVYELSYETSLPPKVVIAEAIRLTRKFSTPEGASFVNAVLDALFQGEEKNVQCATVSGA